MLNHMGILKEINTCGFLTTESQAGRKTSGLSKIDTKPYKISERAYITGFMKETQAELFIRNMALYTDKNAAYVPFCANSIHIPASLDIPLTITEKSGIVGINTHGSLALPESVWTRFRKEAHINKSEKVVYIFCWDTKWNRNAAGPSGLFRDVLRVLKNQRSKPKQGQ